MPGADTRPLRLAVIIPGAVALGAYEAGALTALLRVIRASQGRIVVDTIVGASAGSITGAVLAHALLTGVGDDDLETLWVQKASIETLLKGRTQKGRPRAPLSAQLLEEWAHEAVGIGHQERTEAPPEGIALVMSVANLRGLRYRFAQLRDDGTTRDVKADTFRDARAFTIDATTDWGPVLESAVASSANALAFAPRAVTRRRSEYPDTVEFPGEQATFWYTDGGTVYNVPVGFAIDAVFNPEDVGLPHRARERERSQARRVFLLVHPHPDPAPSSWPSDGAPTFKGTALRAFDLAMTQSIYDDLRHAEKTNTRIVSRRELQRHLEQLLFGSEPSDRGAAAALVREAGNAAWERKQRVRRALQRSSFGSLDEELASRGGEAPSLHDILDYVIDDATGTAGKELVEIEVVSPEVGSGGGRPVGQLLAGELLGHFFGFTLERARRSDFRLGYENLRTWWTEFADGNDPPVPRHPLEDAERAGELSVRALGWRRWWLALRLGWRYLRELFR